MAAHLAGATLPVERWRCDHFTTLDGAILKAAATILTLLPKPSRAKARSRKSIERGLAMPEKPPNRSRHRIRNAALRESPFDSAKSHPALVEMSTISREGQKTVDRARTKILSYVAESPPA
jgi:hypothetical protein